MKKYILATALATAMLFGDGLQLKYTVDAFGQGGGDGGGGQRSASQGGGSSDNYNCQPSCISRLPNVLVGALFDALSHGTLNTHGQKGLIGGSGSGDAIGNEGNDSLGGNSTAGGWGGEKP